MHVELFFLELLVPSAIQGECVCKRCVLRMMNEFEILVGSGLIA